MSVVWRFYMDQDRKWRWQQLGADRVLLAESRSAYKEYEGCLANARLEGYVFQPAQSKLLRTSAR
jgi:hypothetical protein